MVNNLTMEAKPMPMKREAKVKNIFGERVRSLLEDGYVVIVSIDSADLLFCKLRHRSNGNRIVLNASPRLGYITQRTNHITTFSAHYD